jgi:hypothetical protein
MIAETQTTQILGITIVNFTHSFSTQRRFNYYKCITIT